MAVVWESIILSNQRGLHYNSICSEVLMNIWFWWWLGIKQLTSFLLPEKWRPSLTHYSIQYNSWVCLQQCAFLPSLTTLHQWNLFHSDKTAAFPFRINKTNSRCLWITLQSIEKCIQLMDCHMIHKWHYQQNNINTVSSSYMQHNRCAHQMTFINAQI